jgi:hypothetical protein
MGVLEKVAELEEVQIAATSAEDSPSAIAWRSPWCSMPGGTELVGIAQEKLTGATGQVNTVGSTNPKRSSTKSVETDRIAQVQRKTTLYTLI